MNIELRNVQYSAKLSQETPCFSASVYIDGVKRGEASNQGFGGPTNIHPKSLNDEIEAYAKTLPMLKFDGIELEQNAGIVIGDALDKFLIGKKLKQMMASNTIAIKDGKYYKCKGKTTTAPEGFVILNSLPFGSALDMFCKCSNV